MVLGKPRAADELKEKKKEKEKKKKKKVTTCRWYWESRGLRT